MITKIPPNIEKVTNVVHTRIATSQLMNTHLKRELELIGLKADDELQFNTVSQNGTHANDKKSELMCSFREVKRKTNTNVAGRNKQKKTK